MVKRHKRSLTLAALVLLLAQVFLMTFCNVTAIAVTKEESSGSLFDNEFGNASVSYEETSTERLKWTVHLTKATQETATRFMLEVTGDGQAVTPENVQVLTKSNPTMSFAAGNGAGQITAGMSETVATTTGSAVITFDTNRSYTAMTVKPKLIADVTPATDLLAGNTGKSFTIPQVATSESTSENSAVAASEAPVSESSAAEATSSTEVAATEETTATSEVTESTSTEQSATTDSTTASTEATEESDVEDEVDAESDVEADADTGIVPAESHYTGLRFEKTWKDMPSSVPEGAKTVQVQIKRRIVGSTTWDKYQEPKDINYSDATIIDGKTVTVDEWHNLPLYDEDGKGPYEYTLEELPNPYYDSEQFDAVESSIENVEQITSNSELDWTYDKPGYIIAFAKDYGKWLIWTVDPVLDKQTFIDNLNNYSGPVGGTGSSYGTFVGSKGNNKANLNNTVWVTGNTDGIVDGLDFQISTTVTYSDDGDYKATIHFDTTDIWTQFFYGGHTTKMVPITNTYIPPKNITVKKIWYDKDNAYNTRENIQLALEQSLDGGDTWSPYMETVKNEQGEAELKEAVFNIDKGATENELSHLFTVPSKVGDETATYRVVEKVWNGSEYESRPVKGYGDPEYSSPNGETEGTLSVTNILNYDISVQKIWNDNENAYNTRKDIQLVLQRMLEGETEWSDVSGVDPLSIAKGDTGEALTGKFNVPSVVDGKDAQYSVIERVTVDGKVQERVPGYEKPIYNPESISESGNLTVTNNLLTTKLGFTKVGNDESTRLSGVSFTLTGDNGYTSGEKPVESAADGTVNFSELPIGQYTLTETDTVAGYQVGGPWTFDVEDVNGKLVIIWQDGTKPSDIKIINTLKPFDLTVNKTDDQGKALEGAEFTLVDENNNEFTATVSPDGATFTFTGLTAPGTYTLHEKTAPDGYRVLEKDIVIDIDALGKVTINTNNQENVHADGNDPDNVLIGGQGNNQITLSVANDPKAPLPSTGGPGTLLFSLIGMLALGATGLYFYFRKDQEVA